MIVVGASLLEDYWTRHPAVEAQLRALHALLARAAEDDVAALLAAAKQTDGGGLEARLGSVLVRLRLGPGGVAKIEGVEGTR